MPELRKRFDADPETPNFDPTKALEMLHILQLINDKQAGKGCGRARCHYLKKPEYGLLNFDEPKPAPKDERERKTASNGPKTSASSPTGSTRTVTRLKARKHERIRHHPIPL